MEESGRGSSWPHRALKCAVSMATCPGLLGTEGCSRETGLSVSKLGKSWEKPGGADHPIL